MSRDRALVDAAIPEAVTRFPSGRGDPAAPGRTLTSVDERFAFRVLGMALTLTPIIFAAVRLLLVYGEPRLA